LVANSSGIEETRALAEDYSEQAIAAVSVFPESDAKDGLIEMVHKTLARRK
jgi:hexaprenyl-diphosphate synthase